MITAPMPPDESERLAELQALEILDTPAEARFDRIVDLASRVFRAPIAYVAMVDANRQWFKARCGLSATQTARDISFCGHTIANDGPLVINDARQDPRFHDNPLVVGDPNIRFYAGYPLAGPNGHKVGTLCLADREPRKLEHGDIDTLARLAAMAEHELGMVGLIKTQHELLQTKSRLLEAQQRLATELAEAETYVKSLLPLPMQSPIRIDWQFITCSELGGDFFGYRRLDENRLAIYLMDVMGHGVGAALLSTSIGSALRGGTFSEIDFANPSAVLAALNNAFPMEANGGRFFSIWYGVYDQRDRSMTYASAGHPPALLFCGKEISELQATGTIAAIAPNGDFGNERLTIPRGSRLYLFSDGAYEVKLPSGEMLDLEGLKRILIEASKSASSTTPAEVVRLVQTAQGTEGFHDDFSLLEIQFDRDELKSV